MSHPKKAVRRKLKALEKGWNSRAFIADSRNNQQLHETHRAYFDKIPGQRYVSINYDLYGAMANTHRRSKSHEHPGHGGRKSPHRRHRTLGEDEYAFNDDPSEFTVVVHVVSATGERLPGSRVSVHVKHTGDTVGTGVADRTGRAVVVCHYDAWTAVPFYLEAVTPGFVPAGLDFEVTAKECAAQLALESEEEVAHREAIAKLQEEEARRLARQRFTVRAVVAHLTTGKAIPGATVIVRTAHHGSMCGQGVTDGVGVAQVACSHPHWDTTPLRAEVAIRGFVPASADLRAVVGSSVMDTRIRLETEEEVAKRSEEDASQFSVWAIIRDNPEGVPVPGALVQVCAADTHDVLGSGSTVMDGTALVLARHANWATESVVVRVQHDDYPEYKETIQVRERDHRFEAHITSHQELRRQQAQQVAEAERRRIEAARGAQLEQEAAAEVVQNVEDHMRVDDSEFMLTVYAVSLATGMTLENAAVSVVVRSTGQVVGSGETDATGKAEVLATFPNWRHTEFLLQATADGCEATAKAMTVTKTPQLVRVALEPEASAEAEPEDFTVTVHVTNSETKDDIAGARVQLRVKATGDELSFGVTAKNGICQLEARLVGWREAGMYLRITADGCSAAASDINVTSRHQTTEVALDSSQTAAAKRLTRSQTSSSMRAQRSKFKLTTRVVDASSKAPVPGAVVKLSVAASNRVIDTGIADDSGVCVMDAMYPRWNKTPMQIVASKDGWVSVPQLFQMKSNEYSVQATLVEPTPAGNLRLVLTWVEEPQDLDLHVLCPNGTDVSFKYPSDAAMGVAVEIDDRSGYGPETVSMAMHKADDWFRVCACNYSNDVSITVSFAQLAIIQGDAVAKLYHVPGSTSTNEWWDVCGIHGRSGRVVETNYLLEEQPTREQGLRGVDPDGKDEIADDDW